MDNLGTGLNDEIIWDNSQDLFTKYFKAQNYIDRYKPIYIQLGNTLSFDEALELFNSMKL
jgi:hypothetical protein